MLDKEAMDMVTGAAQMGRSFVLYNMVRGMSKPDIIYVGTDKAEAFDALMGYKDFYSSDSLKIEYSIASC